jgi:glycosyltransferase involved in cell wall biosynthesis
VIHVHLIPETPAEGPAWACAEIRLLRPFRHRSLSRYLTVSAAASLPPGRLDVIVMQRGGPVGSSLADIVALVREVRARNARLIYDLDDDLLSRHPAREAEEVIDGNRPKVRFLLREADIVTVSTPQLANRLQLLNPRIAVWENALDEALIPEPVRETANRRVDVGYFGTHSHLQDLLAIVESLEAAVAERAVRPSIEFCGLTNDPRIGQLFSRSMAVSLRSPQGNYGAFHQMLAQEARWAVGLAPLLPGSFNRSKSDIKFLDYAAAGIPTVVSDVLPYAGLPTGEVVLRAAPEEFGSTVVALLDSADLRKRIAKGAYAYLMENRILAVRVPALLHIIQAALETYRASSGRHHGS